MLVVTQPAFIHARGEQYLADIPADEIGNLYRYASLVERGVPVIASSDAPYGPLSPWQVIASAAARTTHLGNVIGAIRAVGGANDAVVAHQQRRLEPAQLFGQL